MTPPPAWNLPKEATPSMHIDCPMTDAHARCPMTPRRYRTCWYNGHMDAVQGMHETKDAARSKALSLREGLGDAVRLQAGLRIRDTLRKSSLASSVGTVAAYVSMGTEASTLPVLDWLLESGHTLLVPRLGTGRELLWGRLDDMGSLKDAGTHRPKEPDSEVLPPEILSKADIILVPALAVDRQGNRLGRGAAWYDQALRHRSPTALTLAVCWPWEFQKETLPAEPHDVRMDGVLTPDGFTLLATRMP